MAIEADTKLRAANDLRKLLLDVESTTSFVLDANSESTEAYELWDCLDALLEDCDTHEDAAALLTALLDSGAVDALVGLMLDFPSLACSEPPVLWTASSERSTWDLAFRALSWLVEYLQVGPSNPSIDTATTQLRRSGMEIIKSFMKNPMFSNSNPSTNIMEIELPEYRNKCLDIVTAILQFPPSTAAAFPSSIKCIQAAVPLIVAMRSTIKPTPTPTPAAALNAERTAQLLAKCLAALGTSTGHSYDIAQSTGVSYDELVRQCLEATDNSLEQVSCANDQLFLITRLEISVARFTSRMNILLDSLIKRHFVTFATSTMFNMQASTDPRIKHDTDRHRDLEHLDVQDACLLLLPALFQRAQAKDVETATPAVEAIESNLLFIFEHHSHSAVKFARERLDQFDIIKRIVSSVFFLLSEFNILLLPKASSQLKVIIARTAQRKARPAVSRLWKNMYTMAYLYGFALAEVPTVICSTPGCTSLEEAKMACGRCKAQHYCSEACQKRDWRVHKSECGMSA